MNAPDSPTNTPRDVAQSQPGVGHYSGFRCAACCQTKGTLGRKLQRVMGLRQYVCKGCYREPKP